MTKILNRYVRKALESRLSLFWQRRWSHTIELRAISVTYENGRVISRKLDDFDIKEEISLIFEVQKHIADHINLVFLPAEKPRCMPSLMPVLVEAWWANPKLFPHHPEKMYQEWRDAQIVLVAEVSSK